MYKTRFMEPRYAKVKNMEKHMYRRFVNGGLNA